MTSSYDSNLLLSGPGGAGGVGSSFQAGLGHSLTFGSRGGLRLAASVSRLLYLKSSDLNRLAYDVAVSGSYAFTRRFSWTISDAVASSYAQDVKLLTDSGILLPKVVTLTHSASTQFGYALTPRTDIRVGAAAQSVGFDSSTYKGGANVSATFGLGRRLTPSQTLNITQAFQRTQSDAGGAAIQALLAAWQLNRGRATFSAMGGVQPYTVPGHPGYQFSPGGGAGWSMRLNESHSIGISYDRTIEQALDRTHLVQAVTGTYALKYRRLAFQSSGNYARGTYPVIEDLILIGKLGSASLQYLIAPNLSLGVGSTVYFYRLKPNPGVSSHRTTMSLSYSTTWR